MRFIRKNGRIVPIRDKKDSESGARKAAKVIGTTYQGAGAAAAGYGTYKYATGIKEAARGFKQAVLLGGPGNLGYTNAKLIARAGARRAQSGAKIALAGAALAGIGTLLTGLARKKKK